MGSYQVIGALKASGRDVQYTVIAKDEAGAIKIAEADGVMVEKVVAPEPAVVAQGAKAATKSKWKKLQLQSIIGLVIGGVLIVVGGNIDIAFLMLVGLVGMFACVVAFVVGRIGEWYTTD